MLRRVLFLACFVALLFVPSGRASTFASLVNTTFENGFDTNSTIASVQIPFTISVPVHLNGTFEFAFTNVVNQTVSVRSCITEVSVMIGTQLVVFRQFGTHVEACDIQLPFLTVGSPGNYTGTLTVVGTSEGQVFRGTVSLLVSFDEPQGSYIPSLNWQDWMTLPLAIVSLAVLVVFVRRRRHRDK